MNFLIITFDFPPSIGGIQTRIKNYVQNLTKMNHKVIVIHLLTPTVSRDYSIQFGKPAKAFYSEKYFGVDVHRYPYSFFESFQIFFSALKALKGYRIDCVHIFSGANTPVGLLFLIYGKINGKKLGVSFYGKDILSSKHSLFDALIMHLSVLLAMKVGVNSKSTLGLLPKMALNKATILYPGVDLKILEDSREIEIEKGIEKRVLFVGRLVKRKGADDLIRAFKLVLEKNPNVKLIIVGEGPQRERLVKLALSLGIQDKTEFAGALVGKPLYKKYKECDVFVMPSKETKKSIEGFGIVFLEAALFKKPVIGTWSGGIPEAVIHGKTGLLVEPGNIKELKEALELLISDKKLAKKLGENAYRRVISQFTWEKSTMSFLKMFQN